MLSNEIKTFWIYECVIILSIFSCINVVEQPENKLVPDMTYIIEAI